MKRPLWHRTPHAAEQGARGRCKQKQKVKKAAWRPEDKERSQTGTAHSLRNSRWTRCPCAPHGADGAHIPDKGRGRHGRPNGCATTTTRTSAGIPPTVSTKTNIVLPSLSWVQRYDYLCTKWASTDEKAPKTVKMSAVSLRKCQNDSPSSRESLREFKEPKGRFNGG